MNAESGQVSDSKPTLSPEKDGKTNIETDLQSTIENDPVQTLESDLAKLTVEKEDNVLRTVQNKKSNAEQSETDQNFSEKDDEVAETVLDQPREVEQEVLEHKLHCAPSPEEKLESFENDPDTDAMNPEQAESPSSTRTVSGSKQAETKTHDEWRKFGQLWFAKHHLIHLPDQASETLPKDLEESDEKRTKDEPITEKIKPFVPVPEPSPQKNPESSSNEGTPTQKKGNRKRKNWKKKPKPTDESLEPEKKIEDATPRLFNDRVPPLPQAIYQRPESSETSPQQSVRPKTRKKSNRQEPSAQAQAMPSVQDKSQACSSVMADMQEFLSHRFRSIYQRPESAETSQSVRPKTRKKSNRPTEQEPSARPSVRDNSQACSSAMAEVQEILSHRNRTVVVKKKDRSCPVYVFAADMVKFVTRLYSSHAGKSWEHRKEFKPVEKAPSKFDSAAINAVRSVCDNRVSLMTVVYRRSFPQRCLNETHFRIVAEPLRLAVTENIAITVVMLMEYLCFVAHFAAVAFDHGARTAPYVALDLIFWSMVEFIGTKCMKDGDYFWTMVPLACRVLDSSSARPFCLPGDDLFGFLSLVVNTKGEDIHNQLNSYRL